MDRLTRNRPDPSSTTAAMRPLRRLRRTYVLALLSIATLAFLTQFLFSSVLTNLADDSRLINLAGRQRMLSQRIARDALALGAAPPLASNSEARHRLDESLQLWQTSHDELLGRGEANPTENSGEVLALFEQLSPHYYAILEWAESLLATNPTGAPPMDVAAIGEEIRIHSDAYLPIMHAIVSQYELEATARVEHLRTRELQLIWLTVFLLTLEALFVFEPATRMVRESLEKMRAADRAKTDFLANMSHEIRTPMNAILGYAEILEGAGGAPVEGSAPLRQSALRGIRTNAAHLMSMLNDLLDMSKIEQGDLTVEQVSTRPAKLLKEVSDSLRSLAESKGLTLTIDLSPEVPEAIHSDPTRLRQVLLNLVGNAIKFTETGSVTLRAFLAKKGPPTLWIEVIDTGIGLDEESLQRVREFRPFQQADATTTRAHGGTGIGLSISAELIALLGGEIGVNSQVGRGSTFWIQLPLSEAVPTPLPPTILTFDEASAPPTSAPAPELAAPPPPISATAPLQGLSVLLVEDVEENQKIFRHFLEASGASVELAENGKVGLETFWKHAANAPFDVVVMDMQMPVMDGYTAARQLRTAGVAQPILALTAHAQPEDEQRCLAAGCTHYLTKPARKQQLIDAVLTAYRASEISHPLGFDAKERAPDDRA